VPVAPKARMSRVAWRGFVRVMRPRTMSLTDGRAAVYDVDAEVDEDMLMVGEGVFLEGVALVTGPARLAWIVELKTWEPVLGVFVDVDASESPGSAKLGTAIVINVVMVCVWSCRVLKMNTCNSGCAKVAPEFVRMTSSIDTRVLPTATRDDLFLSYTEPGRLSSDNTMHLMISQNVCG